MPGPARPTAAATAKHAPDLRVAAHLPARACRYALDVNIQSLDVLNHKRLLDSARADPSAVSFQLRPVDVVSGSDLAKRPSFGSLDTLQLQAAEVRGGSRGGRRCGGSMAAELLQTCAAWPWPLPLQCWLPAAAAASWGGAFMPHRPLLMPRSRC